MRKNLLINLLFILTAFGLYAQNSDIVVTCNNPTLQYEDGEVNTFVWSVTNNGPQALTNVYVTYPIPAGITIPTTPAPNGTQTFWWTGSNGSQGTNVALANNIATLGVNQTVYYTIKIYIPHEYVTPLPVFKVSAIEVVNTDNQTVYTPGTPNVYTVTVTNNGPDGQNNVLVNNAFPAAIAAAGISWSGSNGSSGTGNLSNTIASLPSGATVTYTVTANIPANYSASLSSNVSITLSSGNVNTSGQCTQCNDTDTRIPLANLVVTNTDNQATYTPGTTNTYTLTILNSGPAAATDVQVQNPIPAGITGFSWTGNGASGLNVPLDNTIASIPNGQSVVYTITINVPANYTGDLVNTASAVASGSYDTDATCAGCTDTDVPATGANIVVNNTNNQASYVAGGVSVYTVTVTNQGPDAATNVVVNGAIPAGITSYSWAGSNATSGTDVALSDTVVTLAVGETITYTITLGVPAGYNQPLLAVNVTATSDTTDPVPACTACTDTDYSPANLADVVVVNTDNSPTYTNGSTATYTVTVTNNGPATATNIVVAGAIPFNVADFTWSGNSASGTTALNNTIPSLASGASVVYTVSFTTPDDYYDPITFTVGTTSDNDPDTGCEACSDTDTNAFPLADLVVTNTDNSDIYTPGTPNAYTITVVNNGPADATNVVVTAPLPAGFTAAAWTGSNSTTGTGALNATIPSLAVGETVTYTYTLTVPATATGELTVAAAATSDANDIDPSCTACTDTDYMLGTADVETVISLPAPTYTAGLDAVYTITVTNNGPNAAGDVSVTNAVPTGFTAAQVSWSGSNGTSGAGALNNTIPVLLPGETITYTYTLSVPSNHPQNNIVNSVAVSSSTTDPTPSCATCSVTATANPLANLITVKTDGQSTYLIEDAEQDGELVYTITVTNAGPSDAYNVNIVDQRPTGIDNMTWSNSDNSVNGISTLNQTIPVIPAGQSVTYTVTLYVPDDFTGTLTNTAVVTSSTPDPDPSCPNCSDSNTRAVNYVTVTKNQFTVPQLVEDVLIDTDCVTIQNITWSAGDINNNFGIGYFEANNSNFPLQNGIVIRSGNALNTAGPYVNGANPVGTDGTGASGTDTQLQAVSNASGQFDTVSDVSYIQFEFIPVSDHMSFDFLFASNEYGTYQCGYSDVFAFLLSDLTDTGLMTDNNIALVPGTDTPVSVTNIRNNQYNSQCGSANVGYFGVYNQTNQASAAINMIGQTIKMTAESDVVPNHVYRIKLAIGDYIDQNFDSAVFLEAGSFNIGQPELPTDLTFVNGGAMCFGETYDIVASVENPNMEVKWQKDGQWIYNTDGTFYQEETYTATEAGKYTILGYFTSNPDCFITDDIIVNYYPEIITGDPETLVICGDESGTAVFNLNDNIANLEEGMVVDPGLLEFYFFTSLDAAENNGVPIFPTNTFTGTDNQTIYVRINDYESSCYDIKTFTLDILTCEVPISPLAPLAVCEPAPYDTVEVFDLTSQEDILMSQFETPSNYTITYHNSQEDADAGENNITNPESYPGTTETIYIRVEYNDYDFVYAVGTLDLIVNAQPALEPVDDVSACDSYTLPPLTQGQYRTQAAGGGNVLPAGAIIANTQTIYVFATTGTAPYTCTDEQSFTVTIFPSPVVSQPNDVEVCDSYTLPAITAGNYFTEPGGAGTALFAGDIITQTDDIYIYAESGNSAVTCSDESMFTVTVNYAPVLAAITPLELCDDTDDSHDMIEVFDLTVAGPESVNSQPGYTFTYYTSETAANTGGATGQIIDPDSYSSTNNTVFVRVVLTGTTTDCYSVFPIQLIVHPKPVVPTISDYIVCDDTAPQDGLEVFDLTTKNGEATLDPTDTVTYYTDNGDAQLGQNAITSPSAFQNTEADEQTIYVRVETVNGCVDTGSFKLIVNPLPLADLTSPEFYACEETPGQGLFDLDEIDPVITGGQPYLTAYYATEQDIEDNNQIQQSPYLSATGTIYAVVTDAVTGCNLTAPVSLIVAPAPIAPEPLPIEECDDNNDGVATFNIQPTLDAIIAALGGTVSTTVHETQDDANYQEGTNPITDITSYENLLEQTENGIQTLWIRVNSTQTECYDVVSVDLVVHERPVATDPLEDFHMCDNGDDDSDGTAIFDLTSYAETVLNTMNPAQYIVNYYQTLDAAENGGAPISSPATYASESGTVYLTVTNNATGCFDVVALELVVDPLPVANDPLPYTLCDEESLDNGIEEFDLTSVIPEITENIPGVAVSFYHDYDDAVAGTNAITTPSAYSNDASPAVEAIYVKVEDNETGCYRIVLLDIRVAPLPQLTNPTVDELTVCDTNGQGYGNFDLDALVDGMVNNGVDITVAFYETAIDAENGLNPITNTSDYQNVVATTQTLYVVATNTETGCRSVLLPITLVVAPAPVTVDLEDLTLCDQDSQDQDGQTIFDLTQQNAVIETQLGVAAGSLTIHYFTDPGFAEEGMPRITVPQTYNGTDGQRIWVRIENPDTECYQVASFVLHVNTPLELGNPGTLTLCNEALPNETPFLVTTFDLTVKEDDILTPQGIGSGHVVEYFETDPQAVGGATAIPNPETFENTSNPQTLYVRVTTPEGCLSYGFLTVRVTPLPTPDETPDALELCDDNTPGDGVEAFDLTEAAADIRDNQSGAVLEYYTTQAAAELGDTTDLTTYIATPANYTNTTPWSDSVWVRVTLTGSQPNDPACAKVVELPLIVNPLPPVTNTLGNIDYYAICEPNSTGYTQFDLMGHITGILTANGATPADYTIRFYLDAAAQTAGTALPYVYTNTVQTHQTILVYVQNNATECDLTLPLDLYAEEAAIAYPILSSATITECDYDGANDGTVSYFDLTPAGTEALGTQNPAGFGVEYYTTEAAAEAGDTTAAEYIATPTAYTNESSPQTIWVRITNLTTISGCHDVTSFTIAVETLAEPVISTDGDDHTICVDFDGTVERSLRLETGLSETGYTFEWFLNGADVTADPTQSYYIAEAPGDYTVVATSTTPSACQSQPSAAFNVIQSGQASIIGDTGYVVSNAFGDNQTITVLVEGNGEYQYTIVPEGNEPVGPWQNSNVFTNMAGGYFDIYVRDIKTDNPCDMLQIGGVSVIDYPRFFTPNGDGINDYWNVSGMEAHPEARIYIFDRYGKLLKQLSPASRADQGNGWDGTFNGTPLPSDDYWFRVEFTEGSTERVFKAHFAMKR